MEGAVPNRLPGESAPTKTPPPTLIIDDSHEVSAPPSTDEPASPALTDGTVSPSRRTPGAFSAVRQQNQAAALKEAEAIEQQKALMQETREALARLSQVSSAFEALESELVSRPRQDGDPEGDGESPLSIMTPRKDDDEYKPTSREIISDLEDEMASKSAARNEILQDLQGWALRALAKDEDIAGANFRDNSDDNADNQGVEEEDEDIPCKTCGKSNGMIMQIEEDFEAKARALRANLKAVNEADTKQRMQQREEEMQSETRDRIEAAVKDAVKASIKEKADLGEQIATLQSALKKQGRGPVDGGPLKIKIAELEAKIHDLERSLKDSADEKDMYKKEADALKRKDQARTMAMQAQNQNAKSGAKSLEDKLADAEEKIHSVQQDFNLQTLKLLELEQAKLELENELAAERKVLKRTEEKCGSLEEQLLQERAKSSGHARDKMSSGDGTDGPRTPRGTAVKVVAGKVADIRQKDKIITDLTNKIQEMEKQIATLSAKMEEKDVEMKKQVGTMIKMDTDVERLVAAINHARETLVSDIRVSLQAVFEHARAEETTLLDTVVRENKFFQSRIGRQLLEPRVSRLEEPFMESLNLPVQLRMETTYTFPSVPREEISERLDGFARVSGTQVVPGAPVPPSRLVMSHPEVNDDRLIHWKAPIASDEPADADYLASLNWDASQDRDWVTWVTPNKQTPAVAMLAGAGPSRVTFNAPTEVMISQNQQTRRYQDFLSLERLPAHPAATELSGPPQRQRHWSPSRGRPTSAPMHDRHQSASARESAKGPVTHRTFTATPHKGTALPSRRIPLEMALEQETADNTMPQIPQPAPPPTFAIEPIPLYEDRELLASDSSHPQFYRVSGVAAEDKMSGGVPGSRPVSAGPHSPFDNRHHAYPPLHPYSPRSRGGAADATRHPSPPGAKPASPRRPQQHHLLSPRQHQGHLPPLTIPGEDSIGYKSMAPGLVAQTSSSQYIGESSQEGPADFYGLGLVPSGVSFATDDAPGSPRGHALLPSIGDRPASGAAHGSSILQRKHDVASQHALHTSGGDPMALQQKLVNAIQESREKWNQERKMRLQLEARIKELEASASSGPHQVSKTGTSQSSGHARPVSASRGKGGGSRPQSAGGSIKANMQIQLAAGSAIDRAGSYDGAMSVGGWSDVSNEYSMSLPRIDSSEGLLSGEASKVAEGY